MGFHQRESSIVSLSWKRRVQQPLLASLSLLNTRPLAGQFGIMTEYLRSQGVATGQGGRRPEGEDRKRAGGKHGRG